MDKQGIHKDNNVPMPQEILTSYRSQPNYEIDLLAVEISLLRFFLYGVALIFISRISLTNSRGNKYQASA
jgi:hypothetical protein